MAQTPLYNWSPLLWMLLLAALLAAGPVLWVLLRNRQAGPVNRLQALTLIAAFLTFDLVLFGAFTRLSDSGLGCPDWPGCYGSATPLGAHAQISAEQTMLPSGPVTHSKAWIEMVHRYLAMTVGCLSLLLVWMVWRVQKVDANPLWLRHRWLAIFSLIWVGVQGLFGALTVTMKLFPAIVSLHLLGGYGLLVLMVLQYIRVQQIQNQARPAAVSPGLRRALWAGLALLLLQISSGAWVSTNYAVLVCTEFPQCQGSWWPAMDFLQGFEIWRPLGETGLGEALSLPALTAIHFVHRVWAMLTLAVLAWLAWRLYQSPALQKPVRWLVFLLAMQLTTGLSNVVLGWPLLAALLHTGGAGAMLTVLACLLALSRAQAPESVAT
jgi:cytochrome c oxidase assembly protein subunit 15